MIILEVSDEETLGAALRCVRREWVRTEPPLPDLTIRWCAFANAVPDQASTAPDLRFPDQASTAPDLRSPDDPQDPEAGS